MYGTKFEFCRAGSRRKVIARLSEDRTVLWIGNNPVKKLDGPAWLKQTIPLVMPEIVYGDIDTIKEVATFIERQSQYGFTYKELAQWLSNNLPIGYEDVIEFIKHKRVSVIWLNPIGDIEEELRRIISEVKEKIRVQNEKAKRESTRRTRSRGKGTT